MKYQLFLFAAVTMLLGGCIQSFKKEKGDLSHPILEAFERKILAAFHIWECYRGKFAVRLSESLRTTLPLLDDLAWLAYQPARDQAIAAGTVGRATKRQPPAGLHAANQHGYEKLA